MMSRSPGKGSRVEPFRDLFGLDPEVVSETCVLLPFAPKRLLSGLGVEKLERGLLYSSATGEFCTVILTRIGAVFAGDAVLHLAGTRCREIIFIGTCGLLSPVPSRRIGSLVCPALWYSQESFSRLASGDLTSGPPGYPDQELRRSLLRSAGMEEEDQPAGISFGSLCLQPQLLPRWRGRGVEVVDLESAAVCSAARRTGSKAVSLLAVSDIVGVRPYYQVLTSPERESLNGALDRAVQSVCRYISKKSSG